jgi:hypothetical protein
MPLPRLRFNALRFLNLIRAVRNHITAAVAAKNSDKLPVLISFCMSRRAEKTADAPAATPRNSQRTAEGP